MQWQIRSADSCMAERHALPEGVPVTLVMNKIDLAGRPQTASDRLANSRHAATYRDLRGHRRWPALHWHITAAWRQQGGAIAGAGAFSARARAMWMHCVAPRTISTLPIASSLRNRANSPLSNCVNAQRELGEVVGDVTSDELLGQIFGSFCIGK